MIHPPRSCETCRFWRVKADVDDESWGICDCPETRAQVHVSGKGYLRSTIFHLLPGEAGEKRATELCDWLDVRFRGDFCCAHWEAE